MHFTTLGEFFAGLNFVYLDSSAWAFIHLSHLNQFESEFERISLLPSLDIHNYFVLYKLVQSLAFTEKFSLKTFWFSEKFQAASAIKSFEVKMCLPEKFSKTLEPVSLCCGLRAMVLGTSRHGFETRG